MRPVNLIPRDERRGPSAPARSGPLAYLIIGGLAVVLVALVALALTSNTISDRKAEVSSLEQEKKDLEAQAARLSKFAAFRVLQDNRSSTVRSLAQSRFDWERVMRELAIILPDDVWLTNLTGTATPQVQIENGAEVDTRDGIQAPALELVGCGASQDDVAKFIAALEDIDGVTRVGLKTTAKNDDEQSAAGQQSSQSSDGSQGSQPSGTSVEQQSGDECRTKRFITKFEIVAAFDAVPAPALGATPPPGAPAPGPPPTTSTDATTTTASDATGTTTGVGG